MHDRSWVVELRCNRSDQIRPRAGHGRNNVSDRSDSCSQPVSLFVQFNRSWFYTWASNRKAGIVHSIVQSRILLMAGEVQWLWMVYLSVLPSFRRKWGKSFHIIIATKLFQGCEIIPGKMGLWLSEVTKFWNSIYVLCVSALLPGVRYYLTILPEKISWAVSSPGFPSCVIQYFITYQAMSVWHMPSQTFPRKQESHSGFCLCASGEEYDCHNCMGFAIHMIMSQEQVCMGAGSEVWPELVSRCLHVAWLVQSPRTFAQTTNNIGELALRLLALHMDLRQQSPTGGQLATSSISKLLEYKQDCCGIFIFTYLHKHAVHIQ